VTTRTITRHVIPAMPVAGTVAAAPAPLYDTAVPAAVPAPAYDMRTPRTMARHSMTPR